MPSLCIFLFVVRFLESQSSPLIGFTVQRGFLVPLMGKSLQLLDSFLIWRKIPVDGYKCSLPSFHPSLWMWYLQSDPLTRGCIFDACIAKEKSRPIYRPYYAPSVKFAAYYFINKIIKAKNIQCAKLTQTYYKYNICILAAYFSVKIWGTCTCSIRNYNLWKFFEQIYVCMLHKFPFEPN